MFLRRRREWLKVLRWGGLALLLFFVFLGVGENTSIPGGALATDAGVGLTLALVVLGWFAFYLHVRLSKCPEPKHSDPTTKGHEMSPFSLTYALAITILGGALAGLAAPFLIKAFGSLPINQGFGSRLFHEVSQVSHEVTFNVMIVLAMTLATFHAWRPFDLTDNALRTTALSKLRRYP